MVVSSVKCGTLGERLYLSPKLLFLGQLITPVKQQLFSRIYAIFIYLYVHPGTLSMRNSDLEDQLDYAKIFVGKSHSIG
jgi:hypothetical protein